MYKLITNILKLSVVSAMYSIMFWDPTGISKLCLSNNSPLEGLVYYWENTMREGEFKREKRKKCRLGISEPAPVSNQTIVSLIEEVQKSPAEMILICEANGNSTGSSLSFDGLSDNEIKPSIVDCTTGDRTSDLRVLVGKGIFEKKMSMSNEIDRVVSLEDHLQREKELVQTFQDLHHNESEKNKLLEHELENVRQQLKRERESNKIKMWTTKRPEITTIGLTTTIATILLASQSVASSVPMPGQLNTWPHAKNRVGGGVFKANDDDEDSCKLIDYGIACHGFDYLLRTDIYPFFNAHVSHRSLLEASNEGIILKDEASCEIETNKDFKCYEERAFLKWSCPHLVNSAHFIDSKGKLRIIKCKAEYEITEDCTYCRRIKKKAAQQKQVYKSSIALQDAVCQENSDYYDGPRITFTGVCKIGTMEYKKCKHKSSSFENIGFITIRDKGKYYIENMRTKNIEMVSNVSFICYNHNGQDTEKDVRLLKRVKPGDCKVVDDSKTKHCTGDHVFCEKYDCTKSYPEATCMHAPGSGPILVLVMGVWFKPQCVGYERVLVEREVKAPVLIQEKDCDTCVFECLEDKILIKSTGFKMISAVACSHGSCVSSHQSPSTFLYIDYPGLTASVGGEIGLHLSHTDDSVSVHKKIHCPARDPCEAHSCIVCYHGLVNYQCHTVLSYSVVSFLLVCMMYLAFFITSRLLFFLRIMPRRLRNPISWLTLLIRWVLQTLLAILRLSFKKLSETIGWNSPNNRQQMDVEANRRPLRRYRTTFILTLLFVGLTSACSNTAVSNSKQTKCLQSGGSVKCSITATITLKAGTIGAESCFIIKGPSENQQKVIRVKTVSSETVCREGSSFWTGQFTPSCVSSRRCHLVGDCVGNRCQAWRDEVVSREFGNMKDNNVMSENKCFEQCGAAGCGCFNINPSCLYVHSTFKSVRREAIRVFKCNDWVHRLTFEVSGPSGEKDRIVLNSLSTKFLQWGTISLSLDAEGISGTNSYSFLESNKGGFAIHDEEFSEIPREGYLGEIRCSSESAVIAAHKSCIRAPNLIKYKPMTDQIDCTASLVDPFAIFLKGSLPQSRSGYTFTSSTDKKTVQAFNSGSIKALISINMDDHEIEFLNDAADCDATFLNVSGCYSCNYGAQVCIKVRSSKSSIFSSNNNDNSIVINFDADQGTRDYCRIIHFNGPLVDETLHYSCGGESKLLQMKGSLITVGPYDFRNTTGGKSTIVNPHEESWNLFSWFSGLLDWLGGPLRAILKIVLIIIIGIILFIVVAFLIRLVIFNVLLKSKKN
ncbi:glycoprotein [Phlebovirus CoAr 170255]|nr:glycoprotein [Phlebovirus CoAr 170255]